MSKAYIRSSDLSVTTSFIFSYPNFLFCCWSICDINSSLAMTYLAFSFHFPSLLSFHWLFRFLFVSLFRCIFWPPFPFCRLTSSVVSAA
jgi:hypothetical protein